MAAKLGAVPGGAEERLSDDRDSAAAQVGGRTWASWRRIGLWVDEGTELGDETDPLLEVELFRDVGELGLECLVREKRMRVMLTSCSTGSSCTRTISTM